MDVLAKLAAGLLCLCVAIVVLVWLFKAIYLAVTGLFRADDGHPLLAPIATPLIAWVSAGLMATQGSNGLVGVPAAIGLITGFGGAVSVTILSLITVFVLNAVTKMNFPSAMGRSSDSSLTPRELHDDFAVPLGR